MRVASIFRLIVVLAAVFSAVSPAAAGAEKTSSKKSKAEKKTPKAKEKEVPKDIQIDAETVKLLDRADELIYYLGKEGLKKASCKGRFMRHMAPQPPMEAEFLYKWDSAAEPKGKLTTNSPSLEANLKSLLPQLDNFFYDTSPWREEFIGCKLVTSKEDGKTTIRIAEGKSKHGLTSMVLNEDGLPVESTMANPNLPAALKKAGGAETEMTMKMEYVKFGEKFAPSKVIASSATTPTEMSYEYTKFKKYNLPSRLTIEVAAMGMKMKNLVTLQDYEIEDETGVSTQKADQPKGQKGKAEKGKKSKKGSSM